MTGQQFVAEDGQEALQEVYRHLDHCDRGDTYIAWYGQCRAVGEDHATAMAPTIKRYSLETQPWYQHRFPDLPKVGG